MVRPIVHSQRVHAPVGTVWDALVDVERMPEWTPSMVSVTALLQPGLLAVGDRFVIKQPGMRKMEWVVTDLEHERSFRWSASVGGVATHAEHVLSPRADGHEVDVELSITHEGRGAALVAFLTSQRARRLVLQELAGLANVSEAAMRRARGDSAQV